MSFGIRDVFPMKDLMEKKEELVSVWYNKVYIFIKK